MMQVDTRKIIDTSVDLIKSDGPYKSLNASPYLALCRALGVYGGDGVIPDCADALRAIVRLAVLAERGE